MFSYGLVLSMSAPHVTRAGMFFALLFATLASGVDASLTPEIHSQVNPSRTMLGEPFTIDVEIDHDPAQRFEFDPPADWGDFNFIKIDRNRRDETKHSKTTFQLQLAAFTLGKQTTPKLNFSVTTSSGVEHVSAEGVAIEIVSSLPPDADEKGAQFRDVYNPEEMPIRSWRLLWIVGGMLAASVAAWFVIRAWGRRSKKPFAAPIEPTETIDVRAIRLLDELAKEQLPQAGRFKEYYFRLSEILRGYLGERFGIDALECTTPELLEALRSRRTPGLDMPQVTAFAEFSDLVRYAKTLPSLDACRMHLEGAFALIAATRPQIDQGPKS